MALRGISSNSFRACNETTLRNWLDDPDRPLNRPVGLHIFRQVAAVVGDAHCHGRAIAGLLRPSCFTINDMHWVRFFVPAECSILGRCESEVLVVATSDGGYAVKSVVGEELDWYVSPEEAAGGQSTFASDAYRLGVLLFELFSVFGSAEEKIKAMSSLRQRVLPREVLLKLPKVSSFCLLLLHPHPNSRPKISEVLLSDFLNEPRERLQECETAIKVKEEIDENELLLEFLLQLQQRKQEAADKLHDTICLLSSDFEEVVVHQSISKKCGSLFEKSIEDELLAAEKVEKPLLLPASQKADRSKLYSSVEKLDEDYTCSGSRKRSKLSTVTEENAASKSSRMMNNFKRLEATYFSTRCVPVKRTPKTREGSSFDDLSYREGTFRGTSSGGWINPFLESLSKYLCYSKFEVQAELKQGDLLNSSNLVCALGFDRDKELFATANVNRKIKIFECDMVLNQKLDIHYPVVEMTSRSKLSSICWNSYIRSQIASSNFEGVIQVWDVTKNQLYAEMGEHERRVWSVDISKLDPTMLASGCDDGTVKIWNMNQGGSSCTIKTNANVCSVQFSPDSSHFLAIGSADHRVYCYDRRNIRLLKTVGLVYVYFEGDRQLIADFHRPYKFEEFCWLVDFEWIHCNRLRNK
ncbi:protein SPA1-RELATED 4-like isoform X2 [Ananas comosus]|uniref:Protein SPA1-RELATED 4-like isoform X2 n=1 Tax=Ananas comosus TaxID=4615 RepID=A0A6P5G583_ANACO|nr:protein SPA1-RELATED 4-like isoform X2 [Ananas comosus]